MTLNQIRCFEAVCQAMSFSKAANTLYISQPAISKSISKLERELGAELFLQSGNTLYLTAAGEQFRDFVRTVRRAYDLLREQLEQGKSLRGKTLRLGCPETWNPAFFAGRLEACFADAVPDGKLILEARKLSDLLLGLQSGTLDMVISHDFYAPGTPGLDSLFLTRTATGILYARDRFDRPVTLEQLTGAGFLLYDRDIEKRVGAVIQSVCARRGLTPRITNKGHITQALFDVARGAGVMFFTAWDSAVGNDTYGFYPLEDTLPVKLVYAPERLPACADRFLRAAAGIVWD